MEAWHQRTWAIDADPACMDEDVGVEAQTSVSSPVAQTFRALPLDISLPCWLHVGKAAAEDSAAPA